MDTEKVLEMISKAQDEDISRMIAEIMKRQKQLHPDWEGMYMSFPLKHPDECRQILETTWKILIAIIKEGT